MGRPKHWGICHICGNEGKLSFEHVPPEAAFNNHPIVRAKQEDVLSSTWNGKRGRHQQKGCGSYSLCERCNNNTGSWYGSEYASWAKQGLDQLLNIPNYEDKDIQVRFNGYPLRFLKQAIAMFFSVNSDGFAKIHAPLVKFVLDKASTGLPSRYRVDLVIVRGNVARSLGVFSVCNFDLGTTDIATEVAYFPFALLLRFIDDEDLCLGRRGPIEQFANYGYDEERELYVNTVHGHVSAGDMPMMYRSPNQIQQCIDQSKNRFYQINGR